MGEQAVADLLAALDAQTVVVPGTDAAKGVRPRLDASLHTTLQTHPGRPPTRRG